MVLYSLIGHRLHPDINEAILLLVETLYVNVFLLQI